jgi:proline iminopeptidase
MLVTLRDGYELNVESAGDGVPLIAVHGGGMTHKMFRPYLDPLHEDFRVLYVDQRGQGASQHADPGTLSLDVLARDVDLLAEALQLEHFALLGHSFGAFIATHHAAEIGTAFAYVISGGSDSSDTLMADVEASLDAMGEAGEPIAASWENEKTIETEDQLRELLRVQMPFHFHGEPPAGYGEDAVGSADVVRHFARVGWGDFDFRPKLGDVAKPTLIIVGEHDRTTTTRAARALHEGIANSELVVIPEVGHMSFVEQQDAYIEAVRNFLLGAAVTA